MKTNLLKFYLLAFFLMSDFLLFADPGIGEEGPGGDIGGNVEAPIDSKLFILALIGMAFTFHYFYKKQKQEITN